MQVTRKTRRQSRLENLLFVVLFLGVVGLVAWLSRTYHYQADWTAAGRHSLSEASQALLKQVQGPIAVTAFARQDEALRRRIVDFVARYQRYRDAISLQFVNPDTSPDEVRRLGITVDGELVIDYQGRQEKVQGLTEESFTNALQRVARGAERWLAFLRGHGERGLWGGGRDDLGTIARELKSKGFQLQEINLVTDQSIPDNTTVLVIAGPRVDLLPGEVKIVQDYLDKGGSLLWLQEPGGLHGLEPVAERFGLRFLSGTVVDPAAVQLFGAPFVLVGEYGASPITRDLSALTLFPEAVAMEVSDVEGWTATPFLETTERAWSENGPLKGSVAYDAGQDVAGPLTIGISLERSADQPEPVEQEAGKRRRQQRLVVLGDVDFMSDAYVGNGANLMLAMNVFNWLSSDEAFLSIPPSTAPDVGLDLDNKGLWIISLGFLVGIPVLLGGSGLLIWLRRRKR